jgi:hypothetical protein
MTQGCQPLCHDTKSATECGHQTVDHWPEGLVFSESEIIKTAFMNNLRADFFSKNACCHAVQNFAFPSAI